MSSIQDRLDAMKQGGNDQKHDTGAAHNSLQDSSVSDRLSAMRKDGEKNQSSYKPPVAKPKTDNAEKNSSVSATKQTGYTPAQQRELASLQEQRRQAQVDLDTDTMNELDARMKAIRASAGQQTFGDRADENFSGWVKNMAASYAKTAEDLLTGVKHLNTVNSAEYKAAQQEKANREHYQEMLERGTWDNGKELTAADRAQLTTLIERSYGKEKAAGTYLDKVNAPMASAAEKVGSFGDRMSEESGAHNETARTGATALEKILLDTGNVAADVASDMAGNIIMPGLGTAGRVTRMYGSGSRAAEEKGLGGAGQFAYGATKATLGEVTNRMFSGNPILEKATGKGALDDILFPGLERTLPGAMLKGGVSEAIEETTENLADIPIQRIFFKDKADKVTAKDIGYDALIAAIIGSLTGISGKKNVDTKEDTGNLPVSQNTPAGDMPVDAEGNSMGAAENAVQGVSGANKAAPDVGAAVNENGLNAFSEQERVNLSSGKKNKVVSTFSEAVSFVKNALSNKQNVDRAYLGKVPDAVAKKVMAETGVDISGYSAVIPGDSVRHMFNRHGDPLVESALGQVPLTPEIAARIPEILANPDKVTLSDKVDASGRQALLFEKSIGDQYITVQAVSNGTHSIQTDTLYVKKKTPQGTVFDAGASAQAPNSNVQNVPPQGSSTDATIAQGAENVNVGDIPVDSTEGRREFPHLNRMFDEAGVSGQAENDGLGNANAGSLNSDFDNMQAKSDSFHPVNQQSAQRIMNDQQRAPSEVPKVNPDTGKNIGKTVSTILNSPLTSTEMAVEIESSVADGRFDYIPVTDRGAHQMAQQDLANRGLQTVADSFMAKVDLGQRITKNDMASAIAAYNQAVADGNHVLAFDLMTSIADAAHDSAQVVQAMNLMNRLTPEGRLLTLRKFVDRMNRKQNSSPGKRSGWKNPTQEQVDTARTNYVEQATGFRISDELASNYLMAETDAERAAAWDAITTDIASQIPSTFREKANFWRYTSMLLNPTTHVRNLAGNLIQAGARTIKNGVGAVIERAAVKDTSQRTKSFLTGKEGKALKDFAKTQYDADKTAAMGSGKYSDASAAGINREIQDKRKMFQGSNPLSKAVQWLGDKNTEWLDRGDVLFNKSAYVDSFAQALKAKGVTAAEAAAGSKADLVAQARAYAIEEAQRATYRNTTALSEYLSKKGRYDTNGSIADKIASVAVDAYFPFRRTPSNVLTTGIYYSPVGLAKAITYDAYQVKAGNMSAADMVDHLSAGLTGSGVLALGAYLATEGLLKVRTGDDEREKDYNKDRGMQDYSLQIGDKSYTLDWAVPAAMPLFAGAAIMESASEGGSGFDAVMDAMGGISEVVLETSMLSSLNDLISNWSYADNKALYLLDRTATSYAGQYVPTVGSKIASAMDDTVRKSYVEKGTGQLASDMDYFAKGVAKKIPGAREALQPKVDLWGEEVSNGKVTDRLLQSFLSPGYAKTVDTGALDSELRRLADATGSSAVYPAEVEKSFNVNGETKNLTAEEYTKYAKAVGQTRKEAVSAIINNAGYKKLTDEEKAKAIDDAYKYAIVRGKMAVSDYKPSDSDFAKGAMNSVLPIDSYILYRITADKDGNGSVSGTESAKALQGMSGLTDKQRWQEWARLNDGAEKARKAQAAGLTVGEYAAMKEKADANGDGRVTSDEAVKALSGHKNRVDLWDLICTTNAKNPYQ